MHAKAKQPVAAWRVMVCAISLGLFVAACSGGTREPARTNTNAHSGGELGGQMNQPQDEPAGSGEPNDGMTSGEHGSPQDNDDSDPSEEPDDPPESEPESDPSPPDPPASQPRPAPMQRSGVDRVVLQADFNHITSYGQSLSVHAGPTQANFDDAQVRTFAEGTRLAADRTSAGLVPLFQDEASGIMATAVNQLAFLAANDPDFPTVSDSSAAPRFVLSGHGQIGRPIAELQRGTPHYARGLHQMQQVELLVPADHAVGLLATGYFQGESDADMPADSYENQLITLKDDYLADARMQFGSDLSPRFFIYQIASDQILRDGIDLEPEVPLAQWNAANRDSDIVLVGPTYWMDHPDGIHFSRDGYRHFGLLVGAVMHRVAHRGEHWQPLQPVQARAVDSDTIDVHFHVPAPPLVFDTDRVSNPGHFGFVVRQPAGSEAGIEQVRLIGNGTVRIDLALGSTTLGTSVEYAWRADGGTPGGPHTGPRGNLRDSAQVATVYAGNYPLFNWSVRFSVPVLSD